MVAICETKPEQDVKIIWQPQEGSQELFLSCPIVECLYEGTRGGGKTDALLMDFAQFVGRGFGEAWQGVIFRLQYPDLDEIIKKSKSWFRQIFPNAVYNKGNHTWAFAGGESLKFRYGTTEDDYWNYHGHEFPFVGFEELTSWPSDDFYIAMKSVCRSSYPGMPRHYRATCNPYGCGHNWVKARFIDPAPRGMIIEDDEGGERVCIHGGIYENKILLKNDPEYLKNLKAQTGARRAAWLEGDWDIVAGGMFDDVWDAKVHVIEPFDIPATWRIDRSFDWGSSHPYSVGWWAESDGCDIKLADGTTKSTRNGDLFRIAELYGCTGKPNEGTKELATEVARKIVRIEQAMGKVVHAGPADSSIYDVDSDGDCIADKMSRIGVSWKRANKKPGSRVNGWELLRERLKNAITKEGTALYVFDTCRHFVRTVPVLPRDSNKPDDVNSAAEDHCLHGDTIIVTAQGNKPIRNLVGTTGLVLTVGGYWTEYKNCKLTRKNAEVFRITFDDDSFIICTGDHKILTANNQWKEVKEWKSKSYQINDKNFNVSRITCADTTSKIKASDFIEQYGNAVKGSSQKGSMSTTLTETEQITTSKISNSYQDEDTVQNTMLRGILTKIQRKPGRRPEYGMGAKRGKNGTKSNMKNIAEKHCVKRLLKYVGTVAKNFWGVSGLCIARTVVKLLIDAKPKPTTLNGNVSTAENPIPLVSIMEQKPVRGVAQKSLGVKRVEDVGFSDVYCLNANLTHCFVLANGVIVHNCADEVRYRISTKVHQFTSESMG